MLKVLRYDGPPAATPGGLILVGSPRGSQR
jgi:hypothetical protein